MDNVKFVWIAGRYHILTGTSLQWFRTLCRLFFVQMCLKNAVLWNRNYLLCTGDQHYITAGYNFFLVGV